jgi:hypothetical protein
MGLVYTSQLVNVGWTPMNGDVSGGPSDQNTFERIRLLRQDSHGYYATGVLFNTDQEAMQGNRFSEISWGWPAGSVIGVVGQHGAPLVGPNANIFEGVSIVSCVHDPASDEDCVDGGFVVTRSAPVGGTITLTVRVENVASTMSPPLSLSLFGDTQSFGAYPPDYLQVARCGGCWLTSIYGDSAYVFRWPPLAPAERRSLVVTMTTSGPPGRYIWRLGLNTGAITESVTGTRPTVAGWYRIAYWQGQTIIVTRQ